LLKWSDDGSVGLLSVKEGLYVVNGETGEVERIVDGYVEPWPDISADGKTIVYCQKKTAPSLAAGLQLLEEREVRMIERYAQRAAQEIIDKGGYRSNTPSEKEQLPSEDFGEWVTAYICEKGPEDALIILGPDWVEENRHGSLPYFEMVMTNMDGEESQVVTRSVFQMADLRLSPKADNVAYLVPSPDAAKEDQVFSLLAASVEGSEKKMLVGERVSVQGHDWRSDGQAIVYINASEPVRTEGSVFATLCERIVADSAGNLLAGEAADEPGALAAVDCLRPAKELASTFFFMFSKVQYVPGGRIFFCSAEMKLPASLLNEEEPEWSVYCYDTTIGLVANVLPAKIAAQVRGYDGFSMTMFSVSPDGRKLLLPMEDNRFAIYEPAAGPDSLKIPLDEDEGFDSDGAKLLPAWKGNNEISFIVSDKSHFDIGGAPKAVGTLDDRGEFSVLSGSWPEFELLK